MKRDSEATRKHILQTAEKVFAEQGFDAARMDRIAREAGVNKALIYYYFDSKQAILLELIDNFIRGANGFLIEMVGKDYAFGSDEMMEQMRKYNDYFMRHEATLRLLLTESLKDSDDTPPIFKLIDFTQEGMDERQSIDELNRRGFHFDADDQQRKVTEFFTGIMPTVVYSLFRSKWSRHFKIDEGSLDRLFQKANEDTHDQHHHG
ncbi:MAG: TetR/AcrR family transcriptional regulator [Spirochaetales bacterium]|nr:TetR/AcrR family transcriptional regulator [Spirochaetales bacterium]